MIAEILSLLQIFSMRKTTSHFLKVFQKSTKNRQKNYVPGMFWAFKSKLEIILRTTYIALFLPDINDCFFICILPYIHICFYCFLILCFYFHLLFLNLLVTRHILQFTTFHMISFQTARNIKGIRNTS